MGGFDWAKLVEKRNAYVERLNGIYQRNLDNSGVELIKGWGKFGGENKVNVDGTIYSADHILVAVGGKPTFPAVPGAEHGITSDGFFELMEMAQIFAGLGTNTTLAIRGQNVLRSFDPVISEAVTEEVVHNGVQVKRGVEVATVKKTSEGVVVTLNNGEVLDPVNVVLWAVGRSPNTEGLGCEEINMVMDKQGHIEVDEFQNTNIA